MTTYHNVLQMLTHQQIHELLVETFGGSRAKYYTLDEIPLNKLLAKLEKSCCPACGKEFIHSVDGGAKHSEVWFCVSCHWKYDNDKLDEFCVKCKGSI